ncbi:MULTISPECIES: TonB-dependent receptor [unclassified Caulobacter]|uniref:TonB-dependent receptor n=1 Tax=unclassified Caulobacter TaxID=2648921 RepID=UPI0006F5F11B|nr:MULTISPECIES: TonB-dependent receptor [unclassified Caulobacter]KQV57631.1 TonB-dependent receptor [Caulobacter sp. Root342]KQV67204.1 TonB-dependent receptor [Caulobacter sp. Root343]
MIRSKFMPARCAGAVAVLAFAAQGAWLSQAHAAEPATAAAAEPADAVDAIVVTSYGKSLQAAAALKRSAAYGLDAINAEDIGKFPTRNAAEALQLVTGVTIDRQRGAGLYVSVRGLGPQFQYTELNGRSIAVNDLIENGGAKGRQFRFEVLPAELISQIEVVKTPTADMDEGALGGNINIKTFKPFDLGKKAAFSVRETYNDVRKKADPSFSGLGSWTNADNTLGLLASGLYDERHVRNDRLYQVGWNLDKFKSVVGSGLYTPSRTRTTIETEHRKLYSGALSGQWKPNGDFQTDVDLLMTRLDVDYDEFGLDIYPDDSTFAAPQFVAGSQKVVGDTIVAATINNVRWMGSRETSLNRHDLAIFGIKQAWTPGAWSFNAEYGYSRARSYHPDGKATTRNRIAFFAPLTYDFSRGYTAIPQLTTPVDYTNPANYVGQAFDYTWKDSRDTDETFRLDGSRVFSGWFTKLAFGAEQHNLNRTYLRRDWVLNDILNVPLTTLGSSFYQPMPYSGFLSDFSGNTPRTWVSPTRDAYYNRLYTPTVAAQPWSAADLRNSFIVDQKIHSAYVRGDFKFDLAGLPVSGNLGVRYAETKQLASGTLTSGSTPVPVGYLKTYDNWLPSLNVKVELRDDLIARFAASRVVNRPNVTDSAPRISVSRDSPTASGGNPDLDPFLADQYDASLEWYPAPTTAVTGAIFVKKMDDYITAQNTTIQVPGRGDILLSASVNGGDAEIKGFEAAYNQSLSFLPGPFDGFGVQASVTLVDSKANYFAGNRQIKDDLVGLSKKSYNLVGYYEKGPISARLGWFWRSRYLTSIGSTTTAQAYVDAYGSLDGSVSYQLTPQYALTLEGSNLTDEIRYVYGKRKDQPMEIYHWGRTVSLTLRGKF